MLLGGSDITNPRLGQLRLAGVPGNLVGFVHDHPGRQESSTPEAGALTLDRDSRAGSLPGGSSAHLPACLALSHR